MVWSGEPRRPADGAELAARGRTQHGTPASGEMKVTPPPVRSEEAVWMWTRRCNTVMSFYDSENETAFKFP